MNHATQKWSQAAEDKSNDMSAITNLGLLVSTLCNVSWSFSVGYFGSCIQSYPEDTKVACATLCHSLKHRTEGCILNI